MDLKFDQDFKQLNQLIAKYGMGEVKCSFDINFLINIIKYYQKFDEKTKDIIKNKIICNFGKHLYNKEYYNGSNILCAMHSLDLFHIVYKKHNFTPSYLLHQNTEDFLYNLSYKGELLKILKFTYKDYLFIDNKNHNLLYCIIGNHRIDALKYIDKEIKFKKSDILNIHCFYLKMWKEFSIKFNDYCDFDLLDHIKQKNIISLKYSNDKCKNNYNDMWSCFRNKGKEGRVRTTKF